MAAWGECLDKDKTPKTSMIDVPVLYVRVYVEDGAGCLVGVVSIRDVVSEVLSAFFKTSS